MTAIETIQKLVADQKLAVCPGINVRREITVELSGETYENRAVIKEAGFRWNGSCWHYAAKPSTDDAILMSLAREYTESKLEKAMEEARRASLTDEEREREDRELHEFLTAGLDRARDEWRKARRAGSSVSK